ncbi:MAG: hypothetical protein LUG12_07720 [Erysipelotrichaceae bacterium]|nr:hypothetical protein [Erysipelotrichaceae bacterium]
MNEFIQKQNEFYEKLKYYQKRMNIISILRFIVFVFMIIFLLYGYFQKNNYGYILSIISFILFFILVYIHNQYKKKYHYLDAKYKVCNKHIQRIQGKWQEFSETGEQFMSDKDYKAIDLDIFGHASLFQMINVASTYYGQKYLANLFMNDTNKDEIFERQKAIAELSSMKDFVIEMETLNVSLKNDSYLENWIQQMKELKVKKVSNMIFIIPVITIIAFIGVCFSIGYPYNRILLEIGFVLQLAVSLICYSYHSSLFGPIIKLSDGMQCYVKSFDKIHEMTFQSELLKDMQNHIDENAIKALSILTSRMSYRQNIVAFVLLNGFGLFDFYLTNQYANWLELYANKITDYFKSFGELEAFMSLSILKIDEFDVCMPIITDYKELSFKNLKHPLINKAVGNDFKMSESCCIITGSNMSGKTTFMRMIGLNLVLAYCGGYVFGECLICNPMHILTSMRIKDNVEEGISSFYGELLRIKEMIDYAKEKQPMICFIDEIFKGTNSLDRIAGAHETIKKLSQEHIYILVTTHDYELTHLDCLNYHFEEYYKDNKIYFDYSIKDGPSTSSNGQFLLKQVGILE